MAKPVIQTRNDSVLGSYTENLTLEGNRIAPLDRYLELWSRLLVPSAGLEGVLLESIAAVSGVAFSVTVGGWLLTGMMVALSGYVIGGLAATVLDKRLTLFYCLRVITLSLGFVITLL